MNLDVLVALLAVLPAVDWATALILVYISATHPAILTLRERATTAVMLAVVATAAAWLAYARYGVVTIADGDAITLLAFALVLASMPAVFWLALLITGRFRLPPGTDT